MISELEETFDWVSIKQAAVDDLSQRLSFAQAEEPPRLDEVRTLRRQLNRVIAWNPLQHIPGRK